MKREIFNYLVSKRITPLIFHSRSDTLRRPRQSFIPQNDELQFGGEDLLDSAATASTSSSSKKSAASEQIQVRLEFPGNEYQRPKRSQLASGQCFFQSFISSYVCRILFHENCRSLMFNFAELTSTITLRI